MEEDPGTHDPSNRGRIDRGAFGLMVLAVAAVLVVAVLRVLTRHPFYDECLHARMLWLLSSGLEPHVDYWCNYPVLGYVFTLPVFSALPESAWNLLVLRFLMLGVVLATGALLVRHARAVSRSWVWGAAPFALLVLLPPVGRFLAEYSIDPFAMLAAVGAMVLFFAEPTSRRVGIAAALCILSVLITPKYGPPLLAGMLGLIAASVYAARRAVPTLCAVGIGAAGAGGIALALYGLAGTSPWLDLTYAHLFMAEFKLFAEPSPVTLASSTLRLLVRSVPLLVLCAAGLVGWGVHVRGRFLARGLAPFGIVVGVCIAASTGAYMVQYILPLLVCLVLFVPFASVLVRTGGVSRGVTWAVVLVTLGAAAMQLPAVYAEFDETPTNVRDADGIVAERIGVEWGAPAMQSLRTTQVLLDRIPAGERVLAAPQRHPLFRRDLTFLTADESPSFATLLADGDPVRAFFDPAHLERRLEEAPPAYICLTGLTYCSPPGWREACVRFLRRHPALYRTPVGHPGGYLRGDLLE